MRKDLYSDLLLQEKTHWWHKSKRHLVRTLVKKYVQKSRPKILDVGCGTGMIIEALNYLGDIWGTDNQDKALKFCKQKGLKKIKKGNAERLPFNNNSFDCLTALDLLEHTDDSKSLKEFKRVLKPNAKLILTVPAYTWMWSTWDKVLKHKKRYTKASLTRALRASDLKVSKISYLYSFLLPPVFLIRKIKSLIYSKNYPSDFLITNSFINKILEIIASIEMKYFFKKDIPFGLTIVAVAKKSK